MNKFHKVSMGEWKLACAKIGLDEKTAGKAYDSIELPARSTKSSAGYDFRSPFDFTVERGVNYLIPTGIKCEMDNDKVLMCYPRSSYGFKYGFRLTNTVGVIDSDYYNNKDNEGHIHLGFVAEKNMQINKGDKLFQAVFTKFYTTDNDDCDSERQGGMGSTGK
jgi:dUTP pyrophosphatase